MIADLLRHFMSVAIFLNQSNHLDPDSTLYTVFFGIKWVLLVSYNIMRAYMDHKWLWGFQGWWWIPSVWIDWNWQYFEVDGNHLPQAAQVVINQIKILSSPPTNGISFLVTDVYGRGTHTAAGDAYVQRSHLLYFQILGLKYFKHLRRPTRPARGHTLCKCRIRKLCQDMGWSPRGISWISGVWVYKHVQLYHWERWHSGWLQRSWALFLLDPGVCFAGLWLCLTLFCASQAPIEGDNAHHGGLCWIGACFLWRFLTFTSVPYSS